MPLPLAAHRLRRPSAPEQIDRPCHADPITRVVRAHREFPHATARDAERTLSDSPVWTVKMADNLVIRNGRDDRLPISRSIKPRPCMAGSLLRPVGDSPDA